MDDLIERVCAVLKTTPAGWQVLTTTLPEDMLTRLPLPGEWSAIACLRHQLDVERSVFPVRVRAFLAGEDLRNLRQFWRREASCYENRRTGQAAGDGGARVTV
jgi:hypothetical protein